MTNTFLTLDEAATLEGISYEAIKKRISRKNIRTKTEPNPNGGKERVLIALAALSTQARRKYKAKLAASSKTTEEQVPWYVYCPLNWYRQKYETHFFEAVALSKDIEKFVNKEIDMKTEAFKKAMAKKYNVSAKTIQRKIAAYVEADAWANKQELETGENYSYYKLLAVAREPKDDNNFPTLSEEVKVYIENVYYSNLSAQNMMSTALLYDQLLDIAKDNDWKIPSYDTVNRYINYLVKMDGKGTREYIARGKRYWKNQFMIKRLRNTGDLQVLEILVGDAHTFDCWVSVERANGKKQAVKPYLVAWIDMKSRCLVGWAICECPNQRVIKESLMHAIYPKKDKELPYGVPKYLLIDNGKDFTAQSLTGRPRTERFTLDDDANGFIRCIGIEDDIRSIPYQPWSKAQVERFFGTVCGRFTKLIASYTGTLTGSKTSGKVYKNIEQMLEKGELMSIEEFADYFKKWIIEKYHVRKHQGLMAQGEEIPAPISVFNNADRYFKAAPPMAVTLSLMMEGIERTIRRSGVQLTFGGQRFMYQNGELGNHEGERVQIKYNPEDITSVKVYTLEGKPICDAACYELLQLHPKLSCDALIEHFKEQKKQERDTKDKIKFRRASIEEREELGFNFDKAGKKVITTELDDTPQKVTALPNSTRYKEDRKAQREQEKEDLTLTTSKIIEESRKAKSEYLQKKADEVFAKLG